MWPGFRPLRSPGRNKSTLSASAHSSLSRFGSLALSLHHFSAPNQLPQLALAFRSRISPFTGTAASRSCDSLPSGRRALPPLGPQVVSRGPPAAAAPAPSMDLFPEGLGGAAWAALLVVTSACVAWVLREFLWQPWALLRRLRAQGIPGYPFRPVVGQLPDILEVEAARARDPALAAASAGVQFWFDGARAWGRVWSFSIGRDPFVVLGEPALVRQAYSAQHADCFVKSPALQGLRLLGQGLLSASGATWARQRRLINPAFSHREIRRIFPTMVECTQAALAGLEARLAATGGALNLDEAFMGVTLDIICRAAFGAHLDPGVLGSIARIFPPLLHDSVRATEYAAAVPLFQYLPIGMNRRIWKGEKAMEGILRSIINARLAKRQQSTHRLAGREGPIGAGEGQREEEEPREEEELVDLLELMLSATEGLEGGGPGHAKDGGRGDEKQDGKQPLLRQGQVGGKEKPQALTADQLMDNCFTFLLAGHETTGNTLTWTSLLLSQHPEWQARAREEVNALYAANGGRTPAFEQLSELKLLGWIVNESLRLYPPASLVDRTCVREAVLSDAVTIPAGCNVLVPIAVIHRDKGLWGPDADEFRPDRFAEGVSKAALQPGAFLPFSVGNRNCIGQGFAVAEAKVVLALLLRRFSWTVSEEYAHFPELTLTLRAKKGMPVRLTALGQI